MDGAAERVLVVACVVKSGAQLTQAALDVGEVFGLSPKRLRGRGFAGVGLEGTLGGQLVVVGSRHQGWGRRGARRLCVVGGAYLEYRRGRWHVIVFVLVSVSHKDGAECFVSVVVNVKREGGGREARCVVVDEALPRTAAAKRDARPPLLALIRVRSFSSQLHTTFPRVKRELISWHPYEHSTGSSHVFIEDPNLPRTVYVVNRVNL